MSDYTALLWGQVCSNAYSSCAGTNTVRLASNTVPVIPTIQMNIPTTKATGPTATILRAVNR